MAGETEHNTEEDRQTPKRRRLMPAADGFDAKRSSNKVTGPKFVSAFAQPSSSHAKSPSKALRRPMHVPKFEVAQIASTSEPVKHQAQTLRVLKPPIIAFPRAEPSALQSPTKKVSSLISHPPILAAPRDISLHSVTRIPKFQPAPSTPPRVHKTLPLHDLAPPPPLTDTSSPDTRELKTISTTRVALVTDPCSEGGPAELLSIFLQQHGHGFTDPIDRELQRGLGQSPEKASKSKRPKYVRGGLAERTAARFTQCQTALTLWQKDMEANLSRPVVPDLRLRVVCVLQSPAEISHYHDGNEITVALDFGPSSVRGNKIEDLQPGREVDIWHPWHTLDSDADQFNYDTTHKIVADGPAIPHTDLEPRKCSHMIFSSRFRIV
ncbi:hypothetical protein A0H81_05375 [Grifola frondosa]|uniref:Uncharacterized protein n=1 Tax=Grifola frondosa TaxID=5627 RepID=A0A1C7MDH3_GRIFR|nr:hypothetical protein A0H81_05375 [Grifola frondosa]